MGETPAVLMVAHGRNRGAARRQGKQADSEISDRASSSATWIAPQPKWGARKRARAPSPVQQPGLPGLRKNAPSRLERRTAAMPDLTVAEIRDEALVYLDRDVKASTTHESDDSRLRNITRWLASWGLRPFPPTLASVKALAASLKAGSYRSAHVYLAVYKVEAQRRGYPVDVLMGRHLQDYKRSCLRGIGGPVRPRPLPLDRLGSLPSSRDEWVHEGPVNPRAAVLCGSWRLCKKQGPI